MKKLKILIISILTLSCILSANGMFSFADDDKNDIELKTEIVLPSSYQEYFKFSSPTDIYYDNEVTAILEATKLDNGQEQTRLVLYSNGVYKTKTFDFTLSQLCRFGNFLVTTKESRPYLVDINTLELSEEKINDEDGNEIDVHCFSSNDNYFVKKNASGIAIYKVTPQQNTLVFKKLTPKDVNSITVVTSSPNLNRIAINNDNYVFCFDANGKLSSYKFYEDGRATFEKSYEFTLDGIINDIIADNDYFYILSSKSLQKISVTDGTSPTSPKDLVKDGNEEKKIDDLLSPSSLVFKNDNLLIADHECNKIVELSSKDFSYTGFAITTTANADNRLTANTKDISVLGNKVAVLNGKNGFTIIDGNTFTVYNASDKIASAENIALGKEKVAFTNSNELYFVDTATKEVEKIAVDTYDKITSIAYASGKFYLSTYQQVFIVDEVSRTVKNFRITSNLTNLLTADIDGNIYVYSKDSNTCAIKKYDASGDVLDTYSLKYESKDLGVDINGNVYSLSKNNVIEYFKNGTTKEAALNISKNLPSGVNATSMAISYDSQKIYFLFDGNGFILSTEDAENDAITNVSIPSNFALSDDVANDVNTLKLYNLSESANVYEISTDCSGEKFIYKTLSQADEYDYVYAGIAYCETSDGEHPFLVLANEKRLILIKQAHATQKTLDITTDITSGYIGTKFNFYYYPILTDDGLYALNDATFEKATAISISAKVDINGRSFYYASVNGKNGYIIKTAVTETLAEQFVREKYSYKTLKPCDIYKDATLNEVSFKIDQKTKVSATKVENDLYYVEFTLEDGSTINGFVDGNNFTVEGEKAVRNAIIIGILAFAVSATSIFFIYRKRR